MKTITLYYDSAEVKISTYLLLYFRISGIYVYEKFLDFDNSLIAELLAFIDEKNRIYSDTISSDVGVYIISKENRHKLTDIIKQVQLFYKNSFVVSVSILSEQDEQLLEENGIKYINANDNKSLLKTLLRAFQEYTIVNRDEYNDLENVYKCYSKYKLRDILVASKFFYKTQESRDFDKLSRNFMDAIISISPGSSVNTTWHAQYARLYLAYELNMLCKTMDKRLICSKEYIVENLREMLKEQDLKDSCQIVLLLAQTYDDLFREYNISYEYYLMACNKKNAFAYFKKGEYWNKYGESFLNAIKYYEKSISLFPEYHQAWYNLGVNYLNLENVKKALGAFENVNIILRKKRKHSHLSEMDIEYLYKANCLSGFIYYKYYSDYSKSLQSDLQALDIWNKIDDNTYVMSSSWKFVDIGTHKRLKKKLDVEKLNRVIYHLLEIIGNKDWASEFLKKIQ